MDGRLDQNGSCAFTLRKKRSLMGERMRSCDGELRDCGSARVKTLLWRRQSVRCIKLGFFFPVKSRETITRLQWLCCIYRNPNRIGLAQNNFKHQVLGNCHWSGWIILIQIAVLKIRSQKLSDKKKIWITSKYRLINAISHHTPLSQLTKV